METEKKKYQDLEMTHRSYATRHLKIALQIFYMLESKW